MIVDAIERLPRAEHVRRRGEQVLLEEAGRLNATDLHHAGRHLARVVDPDRDERQAEKDLDREDRAAHLGRFFTVTDDGCGGVRIKGRGTVEDAATLRAALLPLTKPEPTLDPVTCEETPLTRGTTAPGCGTPSSGSPSTPSTPTPSRPATAPDPGSRSPSTPTPSPANGQGPGPPTTASTCPAPWSAGWPATAT